MKRLYKLGKVVLSVFLFIGVVFSGYQYVKSKPNEDAKIFKVEAHDNEMIPVKIEYSPSKHKKDIDLTIIKTPFGEFDPVNGKEPNIPEELKAKVTSQEKAVYILQFGDSDPVVVRNLLEAKNIEFKLGYGEGVFLIKELPSNIEDLRKNSLVRSIVDFQPAYKISKNFLDENGRGVSEYKGEEEVKLIISMWSYDDTVKNEVKSVLNNLQAKDIRMPTGKAKSASATLPLSKIELLAKDANIMYVSPVAKITVGY